MTPTEGWSCWQNSGTGNDGGCRAQPCFKSSETTSWETRWEPVKLVSAGVELFGTWAAYGISLSISVFLPSLYSHNLLLNIFGERTEKGSPGVSIPIMPTHSHQKAMQSSGFSSSSFPFSVHWKDNARRKGACKSSQVTRKMPSSLLVFLWHLKSERDKCVKCGVQMVGIGMKLTWAARGLA